METVTFEHNGVIFTVSPRPQHDIASMSGLTVMRLLADDLGIAYTIDRSQGYENITLPASFQIMADRFIRMVGYTEVDGECPLPLPLRGIKARKAAYFEAWEQWILGDAVLYHKWENAIATANGKSDDPLSENADNKTADSPPITSNADGNDAS